MVIVVPLTKSLDEEGIIFARFSMKLVLQWRAKWGGSFCCSKGLAELLIHYDHEGKNCYRLTSSKGLL